LKKIRNISVLGSESVDLPTPESPFILIPLTQGQFAKISPWRFEAISRFTWQAVKHKRSWYAKTTIIKNKCPVKISMHRFIARTKFGDVCHHKNHDSLDNQDDNLENQTKRNHDTYCRNNNILVQFEQKNR